MVGVFHNVSAEPSTVERAIGHRSGSLYVRNRRVEMYGTVLVFDEKAVVLSRQLKKALDKHSVAGQPTLVAVDAFTTEALEVARKLTATLLPDKWLSGPMTAGLTAAADFA